MKKLIGIVLIVLFFLTSMLTAFAVGTPTLSVSSAVADTGDIVVLNVVVENNPGINTFSLGFDYDDSKIELLEVTVNDNLGGQFIYKKKAVWLNGKDISYNGNLLELKFKVLDTAEPGEVTVSLTCSSGDISNYNEEDIDFEFVSGKIVVGDSDEITFLIQKIISILKKIIEILNNMLF